MIHAADRTARLVGVDLTRGLALLGIMVNHVVGGTPSSWLWDLHAVTFTLLIGVGHELGRAADRPTSSRPRVVLTRAAVLVVTGLGLAALDTRAAVILVNLAIVSLVVAVATRWRSAVIAAVALATMLVAPPLAWLVRMQFDPILPWTLHAGRLDEPVLAASTVLFGTPYPVALWLVFGLVGVLVARHVRLTEPASLARAAAAALLAIVVAVSITAVAADTGVLRLPSLSWLATGAGMGFFHHDGTWLLLTGAYLPSAPSLLFSLGVSVLGLCAWSALCLVDRIRQSTAVWAVATVGSMTLSGYALHIVLYDQTWLAAVLAAAGAPGLWTEYLVHVVVIMSVLLTWRTVLPRPAAAGPLESVTPLLWQGARQPAHIQPSR